MFLTADQINAIIGHAHSVDKCRQSNRTFVLPLRGLIEHCLACIVRHTCYTFACTGCSPNYCVAGRLYFEIIFKHRSIKRLLLGTHARVRNAARNQTKTKCLLSVKPFDWLYTKRPCLICGRIAYRLPIIISEVCILSRILAHDMRDINISIYQSCRNQTAANCSQLIVYGLFIQYKNTTLCTCKPIYDLLTLH